MTADRTQTIAHDVHELLAAVDPRTLAAMRLIAIDGVGGAGKSALGEQILQAVDAGVRVDFDKFLNRNQDKFFDALRLDELRAALHTTVRPVIATGVCMLRVLDAVELRPDLLIYVKRMRKPGWADEDEVSGPVDRTEAPMQVEVRSYHRAFRPHERAEIVLERMDNN